MLISYRRTLSQDAVTTKALGTWQGATHELHIAALCRGLSRIPTDFKWLLSDPKTLWLPDIQSSSPPTHLCI